LSISTMAFIMPFYHRKWHFIFPAFSTECPKCC
jgi:hypothetical protein